MRRLWDNKVSRRRLIGGAAATGAALPVLHGLVPHEGLHGQEAEAAAEHIAKGLYGAFVIDPKEGRPPAHELVMVMNGFDTNFDRSNEVYAVNSVAFAYMDKPIRVRRDELVRIYLVNALE